ncbi:MAG TPA: alpha/beta hydrolase [Thermoanaerobaculia bacterium]|nr:alpha/beta hydrolase [Thermoanaerobaculia bacterium]
MTTSPHSRSGHFRGLGRLAAEATLGVTELVEAAHATIAAAPGPLDPPPAGKTRGISRVVYGSVRGVTRLVGGGLDAALAGLAPALGALPPSPRREALVAALNGVLGDHLEATGNPLAIRMRLRRHGEDLSFGRPGSPEGLPGSSRRVVLLVHGLCMNDAGWSREGHDHGAALERDLGFEAVHVVYNSGRHVSSNGRSLAELLETFVGDAAAPPGEIAIVTHSMGGLVVRSALVAGARAGHAWPALVRAVVFLGTPHHGAPAERLGHLAQAALGVSPYARPFARLGRLRSAGITDLRYGNVLDDDWAGDDRFARHGDTRVPVPLPGGIAFFAVAGTTATEPVAPGARIAGDGLVSVASALGHHRDPERTLALAPGRTWIAPGTDHLALLASRAVYERVRQWLDDAGAGGVAAQASPGDRA